MRHRLLFLIFLLTIVCASCTTLKNVFKPRDPWHGRYLHFSGRFELILDHFDTDATIAKIFELPHVEGERPSALFSAEIKNDKAIFQSRDPSCKVELQLTEQGVVLSDFCHGTGEDAGLYKVTP